MSLAPEDASRRVASSPARDRLATPRRRALTSSPRLADREQIIAMAEFKLHTLYVDYQHLMDARDILAKAVTEQYYRSVASASAPS